MSESMDKVGFSSQEKDNIFRIVAAVMHLGNIAFEEELDDMKGMLFGLVGDDSGPPVVWLKPFYCQVLRIKFVLFHRLF